MSHPSAMLCGVMALALPLALGGATVAAAQDPAGQRPGPPPLESFEDDTDHDGIPDGWYNRRDAKMMPKGGAVGQGCLRFENERPGRVSRLSRAFAIDGSQVEAIVIGLWVRLENVQSGERLGDEPQLLIDFLGPELRTLSRGSLGPWTHSVGKRWTRVAKRIAVPPTARDAIISVGLLGATGLMEIDGMTIDGINRGGEATQNMLLNGDFELGDPDPPGWELDKGARRAFGVNQSASSLEMSAAGSRAMNDLSINVDRLPALELILMARATGLRGAGGGTASLFFLDADGKPLPGFQQGMPLFRWSGSFDWRVERTVVQVPIGALRALLQIDKPESAGTLWIDDVKVQVNPNPGDGEWTPYHVATETEAWMSVAPTPQIEAGSALDASFMVANPAGKQGFVEVRDNRLAFVHAGRARFFGVSIMPPSAFLVPDKADALADRLARSGVNLVRLADLDTPLGPGRSLLEDSADDTQSLDPIALARLDHLIAALKARGIYVALELQSARRYRAGDSVPGYRGLPPGGGPAAAFDPRIRALVLKTAEALLSHVNPETDLPLRDDPVLAWVTISGELTLFDLIEHPDLLPADSADELKKLAQKHGAGAMRKSWLATESAQWRDLADGLRKVKLRVPLAGCSHWRRSPVEFLTTLSGEGLSLIDDRLYFAPPTFALPDRRTMLKNAQGGMIAFADQKRRNDRPYVVSQWANHTDGAWALPYESGDLMLAAAAALHEDWDAVVRRGVFLFPGNWGANATGTGGVEDIFQIPEVINGIPQVFALLPHAASIVLRGHEKPSKTRLTGRQAAATRRSSGLPGWDPVRGRLVIETPYTQGLAGWPEGQPARLESVAIDFDNAYAVVVATSMDNEPISTSKRLLVSAVGRVEPTGFRWVDQSQREVADPGRPPLLQEPVRARVIWQRRGRGNIKAYALDNTGARTGPANLEKAPQGTFGAKLLIDGRAPVFHWELVVEE